LNDYREDIELSNYISEIIVGGFTILGAFLTYKFRPSFKKAIGPLILGSTTLAWVAYIFG
jgi:hypothetical protein